ncbi:hypothetical protein OsI_25460 [Oryza sativa Indica Group]|uniref:Aminotransferase-like plant mobile domain-containing protein n=1 Tax=Oryza sativa subsp. indica TaxID=39946 RepID=B8B8J7_ORYSI|nr:hypothetical protein OsI_25460 [Oryza sativa Indica Group]
MYGGRRSYVNKLARRPRLGALATASSFQAAFHICPALAAARAHSRRPSRLNRAVAPPPGAGGDDAHGAMLSAGVFDSVLRNVLRIAHCFTRSLADLHQRPRRRRPARDWAPPLLGPGMKEKHRRKKKTEKRYCGERILIFFKDAEPTGNLPEDAQSTNNGEAKKTDDFMSQVASCLNIMRGQQLIREAEWMSLTQSRDWAAFRVPTPFQKLLANCKDVLVGHQDQPGTQPRGRPGSMCLLKPVLFNDSGTFDVPRHTATLAQQFITSRTKRWLEDQPMQLRLEISPNDKLMLWARMLMVNPYDRTYLKKAGVLRGIMASIYKCKIDPSLVAAFLTYWHVDGHTLLTSQGEMGYPLHTMYDAMGIPISGRLYEEFIPLSSTVRGYVQTLHNIYVEECPLQLNEGPGIVTIATWVNHFFGDHPVPFQSFLPDGFADPKEPLYEGPNFRVEIRNGRPTGIMCGLEMTYVHTYPLVVYRAAFIAAWLCTYCVPVEEGNFIRPEVFTMAVEIAQGSRQAIGVTSMAFLYRALDNVYHQVAARGLGGRVGTPKQRTAKSVSISPEHQEESAQTEIKTTSPLPTSSANPTEIVRVGPDRSGKDFEKIRACIANPDNVTTHVSAQASQQELLLLPPRNETALNSSAMTHIDPYSEGLAIPHDDIGTLPTDLLTGDFSDLATLLEGGANPETSLCLDSPIFPASLTGVEELSNESNKLSMDVEQIVAQILKAPNVDSGAGENSQFKEFHGNNPSEIKAFQELLKQRPIQKDIVLKEISINLDLWSNFFSKPPPEIIRLMEGLRVLKRALSEEAPLPTTKIDHHIDMLRTAQDKVESSCVALAALTSQYNVERAVEEGNKRECSRQAQKIKAEIAMLQAELQQVEDDYSCAQCHQDVVIENLNSHLERHHQAKNRGSEIAAQLEQASVHQKSLQNIVVFTKPDEFGLSQYVYNIFDFFIGCSLDE